MKDLQKKRKEKDAASPRNQAAALRVNPGKGRILRNSLAIMLQSCGKYTWGAGNSRMIDSCTNASE